MKVCGKLLTSVRLLVLLLTLSSLFQQCMTAYCEVLAPAATQTFDNTERADKGGTANDEHIIFRMGTNNTYALNSPFQPQDSSCWIEYKLVMKGTDTEVRDAGWDAARVFVSDGDNNGQVSLSLFYHYFQQYRDSYEKAEPEFEIVAQGHEPKDPKSDPPPQYSPVKARVAIKVKFIRHCAEGGVGLYTKFHPSADYENNPDAIGNQSPNLNWQVIVLPGQKKQIQIRNHFRVLGETTRATCDYWNSRGLRVFLQPQETDGVNRITFDQTIDPSIYSLNQSSHRAFYINIKSDTQVASYNIDSGSVVQNCKLGNKNISKCITWFIFQEMGLDGWYPEISKVKVTYESECRIFAYWKAAELRALWSWPQSEQDKAAIQYRLRDPPQEWIMPQVKPVLPSGEDFMTRCGVLRYDVPTMNPPEYYEVIDSENYLSPLQIKVQTADETIVKDYASSNFERQFNFYLRAVFMETAYNKTMEFVSHFTIKHTISDYCLGWTVSQPNITILNQDSIQSASLFPTPKIWIKRFVLAEETLFDFSLLTYTQLDKDKVDFGCGMLEYIPHFFSDDRSQLIYAKEFDQPKGKRINLKSDSNDFIGIHLFEMEVHSDIMTHEPHFKFEIIIEILPCQVRDVDTKYQKFKDQEVIEMSGVVLALQDFVQEPLCNYTSYYTVTMFEKPGGPTDPDFEYDSKQDGTIFGLPPLVTVDTQKWRVLVDAKDRKLVEKTFQVFITQHVLVNRKVQDEFYKSLPPFDVTVLPDPTDWPIPNYAPFVDELVEEITLYPGKEKTVTVGLPYDIEDDDFYVQGWEIKEGIVIPWIKLNNETSQTEISFTFSPPINSGAMDFTLKVNLIDKHRRPSREIYEIGVFVEGQGFVPDFNKNSKKDDRRRKKEQPEGFIYKKLDIEMSEPSNSGLLKVNFGAPLALPANVTEWNPDNEGGSTYFSIQYEQSEESMEVLEELRIQMSFGWRVAYIDQFNSKEERRMLTAPTRSLSQEKFFSATNAEILQGQNILAIGSQQQRQQSQYSNDSTNLQNSDDSDIVIEDSSSQDEGNEDRRDELVFATSITLQLAWTQPLYVSAYEEKDNLEASISPRLFDFDDNVLITDEQVEMINFRGKLQRQVSAEQLATIQQIGGTTSGFLQFFMSTNVFFSIFMIHILQYLWGLINTLQMIVIIVLFNVHFPFNCATILIDIMQMANLDLLSVDQYTAEIFNFSVKSQSLSDIFDAAGFKGSHFTTLLGMLFFVITLSIMSSLLKLILRLATKQCDENCLTRPLRKKVNSLVIVVRFFMESCNTMGLAALICLNTDQDQRWNYFSDGFDIVLAWIALFCLLSTPFFVFYYGRRLIYKPLGFSESEKLSVARLFNQYREKDIAGVRYCVLFFFRRFTMLIILTVLPSWMNAQLNSQIVTALFVTLFTIHYAPYKERSQNRQEIFNEWTVLTGSYHLYLFTHYISDEERRYELGWSLIGLIVINVIFNFTIAFYEGIRVFYMKAKAQYYRRKKQKQRENKLKRESREQGHRMISIDTLMRKRDGMIQMRQMQDQSPVLDYQSQTDYHNGNSANLHQSQSTFHHDPDENRSQQLLQDYAPDVIMMEQPGLESEQSDKRSRQQSQQILQPNSESHAALQPLTDQMLADRQVAADDAINQLIDDLGVDSYYEESPLPRSRDSSINYINYKEDTASLSDQNYDNGHHQYYTRPNPLLNQPGYSGQIRGRQTQMFENDRYIQEPSYNGLINGSQQYGSRRGSIGSMDNIGYPGYGGLNHPSMLGMKNREDEQQRGFYNGRFGTGSNYDLEIRDHASQFAGPDIADQHTFRQGSHNVVTQPQIYSNPSLNLGGVVEQNTGRFNAGLDQDENHGELFISNSDATPGKSKEHYLDSFPSFVR